ncbi:NAD(P)-dependent oxidoreductase [Nocardioides sp.]|uniref:NAD(P)-dependent oxidoreductase n=1 Tax=Nocardioides sp. TaxID=35761 RepID=UPI0026177F7D|nr:NAD(P)-dependent oxidoreductase [Nocardioides sp.]
MSAPEPIRVGFVGLGTIGRPMALRLAAAADVDLRVVDLAPEPVAALVAAGAEAAESLAALGAWAEVVCVMVRDDAQVRAVLVDVRAGAGERGEAAPLRFVIHSTVASPTPAELAAAVHGAGIEVLDAPVSGGPMGAAEGTLAIMVGASPEAFAAVGPVLAAMGTKVIHAGEVGTGTRFKLARNLLHFVSFTAATEAARLAEAAGLDLVVLGDVVRHTDAITGGPGAILYRSTTAPIEPDDFWHGVFSHVVALGEKDLSAAIRLADELGIDVPLARRALSDLAPGLGLPRV